jgi:exopolysaccharide biosynthesis polyprenyl glycosylphosphotransferase
LNPDRDVAERLIGRGDSESPLGTTQGGAAPHLTKIGVRRIGAGWETRPAALAGVRGPRIALQRDGLFRHSLLAADLLTFLLAALVLDQFSPRALVLTWASLVGLLGLFFVCKVIGLYDRDEVLLHKTTLDEAPKLFLISTLGVLGIWLAGETIFKGGNLDRSEVLLLWALLAILLPLTRGIARAFALRLGPPERCLFVGDPEAGETIESKLGDHHGLKAELVAQIDPANIAAWSTDAHHGPRLSEIRHLATSLNVQRAIIAPDSLEPQRMLSLVSSLDSVGVRVSVLPRMLEVVGSTVEFDDLHGVTVMGVRRCALTRSSLFVKRSFDVVVASLGMLAVSPLMILIAIAIKLDSRGPVFFRQCRVGRHGQHFGLFKFRTMVPDADQLKDSLRDRNEARSGLFKIADDPRVTRVGKRLRRSAFDELPQLLNVIRGEMSLVGPRPLVVDEDENVKGWYRRRLELMPGMTGPWQILGPARVPLQEMGAMDYLYVSNWSLWSDIKILLRTVPHVVGRRGL